MKSVCKILIFTVRKESDFVKGSVESIYPCLTEQNDVP